MAQSRAMMKRTNPKSESRHVSGFQLREKKNSERVKFKSALGHERERESEREHEAKVYNDLTLVLLSPFIHSITHQSIFPPISLQKNSRFCRLLHSVSLRSLFLKDVKWCHLVPFKKGKLNFHSEASARIGLMARAQCGARLRYV